MEKKEKLYNTFEELALDVKAFEEGTLSRSQWSHRTHLAVAFWYLSHLEEAEAKRVLSENLQAFLRKVHKTA